MNPDGFPEQFDSVDIGLNFDPINQTVDYHFTNIPTGVVGEFFEWIATNEAGQATLIRASAQLLIEQGFLQ